MNSILRQTGLAALAFGLLAAPAIAAPPPGTPSPDSAAPSAGPAEAAGKVGVPGAHSVTGANTDAAVKPNGGMNGSTMGKSQAELPNNDAGTPINKGPAGSASPMKQGAPSMPMDSGSSTK